jgi:hypothetical protein
LWNLLSAGVSLEGTTELAESLAANRRAPTPCFRTALIAPTSSQLQLPTSCGFRTTARATVKQDTPVAPASRNAFARASTVAPVVITSSTSKTRLLSTWLPGRVAKAPRSADCQTAGLADIPRRLGANDAKHSSQIASRVPRTSSLSGKPASQRQKHADPSAAGFSWPASDTSTCGRSFRQEILRLKLTSEAYSCS